MEKLNALSMPEKLIAGGGLLMLIASFLPWYKVSFDIAGISGSVTRNGWESPGSIWSVLATLIAVVLAGTIVAVRFGNMRLPDLGSGISWAMIYAGGGAVIVLCIILKFLGESSSISYGFFLGIIAAIAIAAGGYLIYQEEKGGMVRR